MTAGGYQIWKCGCGFPYIRKQKRGGTETVPSSLCIYIVFSRRFFAARRGWAMGSNPSVFALFRCDQRIQLSVFIFCSLFNQPKNLLAFRNKLMFVLNDFGGGVVLLRKGMK